MSYVLRPLEAKFANLEGVEDGVSGYAEIATILRRLTEVERDTPVCSMGDYADFNR